jgi:Fe-S cluster assembly protein SufD
VRRRGVHAGRQLGSPVLSSAFTPERSSSLGGPAWLQERRAHAVERLAAAEAAGGIVPTTEPESWRYSRIAELHVDRYDLATGDGAVEGRVPDVAGAAAVVVVGNGRLVSADVRSPHGVSVDAATTTEVTLLPYPEPDGLTALHDAFVADVVVVTIAPGAYVDGPIVIVNATGGDKAASFPHVVVEAGAGSEATVVEWATSGDAPLYVDPVTELHVGDAANLRHVLLQDLGEAAWQTGHLLASVGRDATLRSWLLSIGGEYARTYVVATLPAQGATAKVAGVYFGDEHQMHDIRSVQDHIGTRSVSDFRLKGAVVDESRGVYTGIIRVHEGAKATESFLANRNLVLSDGSHVDSVPNLEIVNENDIRSCGHAAATGPVDEEHLFYLESRGIPTPVAQQLIVYGFFEEVVAEVPVAEVRDNVRAAVARKLAKVVGE